jgi:hypothetical protein
MCGRQPFEAVSDRHYPGRPKSRGEIDGSFEIQPLDQLDACGPHAKAG